MGELRAPSREQLCFNSSRLFFDEHASPSMARSSNPDLLCKHFIISNVGE